MAIIVDEEKCTGCGECADVCPVEAIVIVEKKAQVKIVSLWAEFMRGMEKRRLRIRKGMNG